MDSEGESLSILGDWRATLMANAARDPYWQAKVEAEVAGNPGLRGFIEDKCTTCHAPMGRTQAHFDGAEHYTLEAAVSEALGRDGVSCTLCHQIRPKRLGKRGSFTGGYVVRKRREIFGPYEEPFPGPMLRHVNFTPLHGEHVQTSALCATCHTLFTPIFDAQGAVVGQFPEQTPYLEWRASDHATQGRHCQDCHMPRVDEPVRISSMPPWLKGREPFWRHGFVGGNAFVLGLLGEAGNPLGAAATPEEFGRTRKRVFEQLGGRAARLIVTGERSEGRVELEVEVRNLTGHKFPTGFPSRRAWLHVKVSDAAERVVFESGAWNVEGEFVHSAPDPGVHWDVIVEPRQTQVYEAVMGDVQGRSTTALLRAVRYLKDNRIPPRGFRSSAAGSEAVRVVGVAEADTDFNRDFTGEGSGADKVRYRLPVGTAAGALKVEVELVYQAIQPRFADEVFRKGGDAARRFEVYYRRADRTPVVVQSVQQMLPGPERPPGR